MEPDPAVRPPAVTRLRELLHRLEQVWRRQGVPIASHLRPGLAAEDVVRRLRTRGITPTDEVLEWWSWHDGTSSEGIEALGHPGARFLSLDQALEEYDRHVRAGYSTPDNGLHGWFPLLHVTDGSVIVVDCRYGGRSSTVTWISRELELRTRNAPESLTVPVEWWVEFFETGVWHWDPAEQRIEDTGFDDQTFPERRDTGLM